MVVNDYRRTWEFLLRAPFKHKPISLSRIVFKPNETRPFIERVQHGVSQTMRLPRPARR
jgi:hypothetical protein